MVEDITRKNKINFGRKRIILDYAVVDTTNFLEVFNKAMPFFESNQRDCEYLIGVYLGKQDILNRPAPNTSNINNKCVVNYTYPITREIVGYTFGNPFEFIPTDATFRDEVNTIADICNYAHLYATDIDAATYASICGIGYEITLPSPAISETNIPKVPIIASAINPTQAFVVQSTAIGNPSILSGIEVRDSDGNIIKYICFTDKYKFTVNGDKLDEFKVETNPIGLNPITMIENSLLLTGDWEQAMPVINAINQLTSDSLNDVEGTIRSLLVILGTDLGDAKATLATIKDKRLLSLFNASGSGGTLDAKFISPKLDSAEVTEIRNFLNDAKNIITGIPDRQSSSLGGDTGTAVINRNGWTDIEIVAKLKELLFKKAKVEQLSVIIAILKSLDKISNVEASDITISLGRNTLDNLSTKAQAFATLVGTGELATIDALDFSGLTNRTSEVVARGEAAKEEREQKALEIAQKSAKTSNDNPQTNDESNTTNNAEYTQKD